MLLSVSMVAQETTSGPDFKPRSLYSLTWAVSIPLGDFNRFIHVTSPLGAGFSGKYFIKDKLALGFNAGWNGYYEKVNRQTYYFEDGLTITAAHYRYSYIIPFEFTSHFFFSPGKLVIPYVGLALGGNYMEEHIIVQDWDFYNNQWGFQVSPELGAIVKFGTASHWGVDLRASYWLTTNFFEFGGSEFNLMQGLNVNFGVVYLIR